MGGDRRFGFVNVDALNAGETGPAARGEEHELVLIWSLSSGKRQMLMDGKEIHFSMKRNMAVDCSFQWRGDCIMKIVAHAAKPLQPIPGFRQYDMLVNGQSFFEMPKVFELGLEISRGVEQYAALRTSHQQQGYDYNNEQYSNSQKSFAAPPVSHQYYDQGPPAPGQYHHYPSQSQTRATYAPNSVQTSAVAPSNQHEDLLAAPSEAPPAYAQPVPATPTMPYNDPFNPQIQEIQPTLSDISNQVMGIYNNYQTNDSNSFSPHRAQSGYQGGIEGVISPLTCDSGSNGEAIGGRPVYRDQQDGVNPTKLSLRVDTSETALTTLTENVDEVTKGMKMLVNLDDINSPVEGDFRLTMGDSTAHVKNKPISKRSPKVEYIGPQPTLSEMKSSRPTSISSSKEVMKQPTCVHNQSNPQGGALVVYGSQQNGAPPLQRSVGFGVGVQMQNGGYGGNQQANNYYNGQQYAY